MSFILHVMFRLYYAKTGEGLQVDISRQIKAGARAFLQTEYLWLIPFIVGVSAYIVVILEVQKYYSFIMRDASSTSRISMTLFNVIIN